MNTTCKDENSRSEGNAPIRVGWLEKGQEFNLGPVSPSFLQALGSLYKERKNQTRGYHFCPFCTEPDFGLATEINGQWIKLGSAEVHVSSTAGLHFVAPDLIYHYIVAHRYRPPEEFIDAVLSRA